MLFYYLWNNKKDSGPDVIIPEAQLFLKIELSSSLTNSKNSDAIRLIDLRETNVLIFLKKSRKIIVSMPQKCSTLSIYSKISSTHYNIFENIELMSSLLHNIIDISFWSFFKGYHRLCYKARLLQIGQIQNKLQSFFLPHNLLSCFV